MALLLWFRFLKYLQYLGVFFCFFLSLVLKISKVVEVSTKDNTEVFEATIFFKSTNKGSKPGWGQTDILYRSERMELKN